MATLAVLALAAAVQGCTMVSSQVTDEGHATNPDFPRADNAWPAGGTFPNVSELRLLDVGMTKDQLYALAGPPHFNEVNGTKEWDYLFNFRTGKDKSGVLRCQMKAVFDKDMQVGAYYWNLPACADLVNREPAGR